MSLTSVYHSGPVTALCYLKDLILAGVGCHLNVYTVLPSIKHVQVLDVLPGRSIHGIVPESSEDCRRLCVYGQKSIRLVELDAERSCVKLLGDLLEFSDWIWDVTWLQDGSALCLALGHNVVVTFDLKSGCVAQMAHCEEKCILYCAKFLTLVGDRLVLAAGTVFNQVVIWSPVGRQNAQGRAVVFHRLTGHQGVIFSIDYDPVSRRICSVSDDRSIRLYQVRFPAEVNGPLADREPDGVPTLGGWENMETSLLHVLYGHSARVWDVKLLSTVLVSVGEDSTCCVWSYQGEVLQKLKGHKGKSIWSMAVDKGENYVITGGGDHSVRLWNLKKKSSDLQATARALDLNMSAGDFPRNTQLLGYNRAVVITDQGKLLMIDTDTNKLSCLFSDEAFSSYTVMAVSAHTSTVAIGNIHGTLRILHASTLSAVDSGSWITYDVAVYDGRVFSVLWLDDRSVLTTGPGGVVNLWILKLDQSTVSVSMTDSLQLPPSKQRWVTTAAYVSDGSHLVCGDRSGSVFLYRLANKGHPLADKGHPLVDKGQQEGMLVHTFPKIHGKGGVTHVCWHGDQVYSAGRDGRYRVYALTDDGNMALLNTSRVCKGFEWLETLIFTEDGDLQIHGFYTNMFVVWSVKHNQKILEVECGGGHRAWSYGCHDSSARLVYVKAGEVMVHNVAMRTNQTIVKGSLHGRELCDVKHVATIHSPAGSCSDLIASCSEDTTICLSVLIYDNGLPSLSVLHTLSGHISSVRCLAVCPSSTLSQDSSVNKLIFSAGGRAQMKVWRVRVNVPPDVVDNSGDSSVENVQEMLASSTVSVACHSRETDNDVNRQYCEELQDENCDKAGYAVSCTNVGDTDNPLSECNDGSCKKSTGIETDNVSRSNCDTTGKKYCYNARPVSEDDTCKLTDNTCVECLAGLQLGKNGRRRRKPWRQPADNSDPETRILDLSVFTAGELDQSRSLSLFFVSAACSDGLLRFFAFEEDSRELTLLTAAPYHDHCILKTCHMILPHDHVIGTAEESGHVTSKNRAIILSAATDGVIAFWDMSVICESFMETTGAKDGGETRQGPEWEVRPFHTLTLHQSGINSVHVKHLAGSRYMLVTGGDDNAVHITIVSMVTEDDKVNLKVISKGGQTSAHAAQITGAWCFSPHLVVTASIDQRVALWTISELDSDIKVEMVDCKFVNVSDVANIHAWKTGLTWYILVCGEGLELLQLDVPSLLPTGQHVDSIVSATRLVS